MKLGILSALRRIQKGDRLDQAVSENSDIPLEEEAFSKSGLMQSELRVLFKSAFVEMERDLPVAAGEKGGKPKGLMLRPRLTSSDITLRRIK